MFDSLSERLDGVVKRLRGVHKLSEENISDATREVRLALLEADVNIGVVKEFIADLRKEVVGARTEKGISPGQQFIKTVHTKLKDILGGETATITFADRGPTVILMTGLQGSGKTTTSAKLAMFIRKQGYVPMMVSADVYRPAAMDQLKALAKQIDVALYDASPDQKPIDICKAALKAMEREKANVLLVDTAGRLHIDDDMMEELAAMKKLLSPSETLFVADAMTGQDAVTTAAAFNERIGMTGVVLTKLDGDARGGAALSIKSVTGAPIKFSGIGEKLDQLEQFHPERVASRILGMGDVLTLIEKAQENIDQDQAARQAKKMLSATFDLNDFLEQLQMVKKMGPLESVMKMIPGAGDLMKQAQPDLDEMGQVEAIIQSMTMDERNKPGLINASRKRRIARGSGTEIADVNKVLKNFQKTRKMMKGFGRMRGRKKMSDMLAGLSPGN